MKKVIISIGLIMALVLTGCAKDEKKENEKVVAKFLESYNNFEILEEKTVFPTPFGGDGFYYALMRKNND